MIIEKAKNIIFDCVFNGEYRANKEQEEAYYTLFPNVDNDNDNDNSSLDIIAKNLYPDDYNNETSSGYIANTQMLMKQDAFVKGGNYVIKKTIDFLTNNMDLLQSNVIVSKLVSDFKKAMEGKE